MADGTGGGYDIAVIGMAGRFPGASNPTEFWRNLREGKESVRVFSDEELLAAGESLEALRDPSYVKVQPVLADFDHFDAGLFGFSPQDAAIMDPQHRVFLEVGWEALENAGHTAESFSGNIGVFATCGMNTYMMYNLVTNRRVMETVGEWLVRHTGNDMNFLATRLSYALNLKGPSMNVQTACSSALVALHLACQSLISGECDLALAGGSTIVLPHNRGYLYKPGEILSPDGHCRAFDARARGTLFGSGAGMVALRRLADAERDGDQIFAVIKGSAINNDGSTKVGYLAPSVEGQAKAITEALAVSGVEPDTISYVEMHGTGTIVGDPIEVTALTQAWRQFTARSGFCAIGSVKSNIGHLGEAAGAAALIKTVLALGHKEIPPSLHYESPNPQIDFPNSPFFVNAKLTPWAVSKQPRRAAVTSLGAGGTNCHVIIEEAPPRAASTPPQSQQLLVLSARTPNALAASAANLAAYLRSQPDVNLADVAFTLHVGRKVLPHRLTVVCRNSAEAIAALESPFDARTAGEATEPTIAFLFPGQGSQYPNMGKDLYGSEPIFRQELDACAEILRATRSVDILPRIFSQEPLEDAQRALSQTAMAQPALFSIEYALARLWMSWGVVPSAMIGHSVGEYVAACLAGVFSLPDALALVADRGALMQEAPGGAMLAIPLAAADVGSALAHSTVGAKLSLAVINAPNMSVVGGPYDAITAFESELAAAGTGGQRLRTSHAFHTATMEPVLAAFGERARRTRLHPPSIPYVSNLTGTWIQPQEATDPNYWVQHLRNTVRFSDGLATLVKDRHAAFIEVGPGHVLSGLTRQQPIKPALLLQSLGRPGANTDGRSILLKSYGELWVHECKLDAARFYTGQRRCRVSLPSYPFERKRYWVEAGAPAPTVTTGGVLRKRPDIADWFSIPGWEKALLPAAPPGQLDPDRDWLVFLDEAGVGSAVIDRLRDRQKRDIGSASLHLEVVEPGDVGSLALKPFERRDPGPGDVEIRVRTAALNFADVLKATGVFPDAPFGMECAGVVERVGTGVETLRPGDEVVAIGPESFQSFVLRDARFVAAKPERLSAEEAVTLPAAFMTAWYALHHVGGLRAGEKILIHSASGGVGLAAIQVAHALGAEVFATAGSKEKRSHLESLGIRHVFDSRTPGFADEILKRTGGEGVNVALNSLTGAFIPETFSVLAGGGRFLEIGKREIYSPEQIAELHVRPAVTYHPIDLTRLLRDDPDAYGALLHEVVEQTRTGRFQPITRTVFNVSEAGRAFQLMLLTRHIGKIVLAFDLTPAQVFRVRPGSRFRCGANEEFTIRPGHAGDYVALLEALEAADARIGHIAHFWCVDPAGSVSEPLEDQIEPGFFSMVSLGKALGSRDWAQPIALTAVSTNLQQIAGETLTEPAKATVLGPVRVLPREFPNVACRSVDVPATRAGGWQRQRVVEQLVDELTSRAGDRIVAYRSADRWSQRLTPARLDHTARPPLRDGGVYLITGGLGGLALELAEHLARTVKAKLILVGRAALPARADWDAWLSTHTDGDPVSLKIRKIQACETHGAEVFLAEADVTDRRRMRAVVAEARKRFGTIHGVVHAAGTLDDGLIQLKTTESALGVLAPKVIGALVLDDVLGEMALDFFVLFSSVSATLGLQGQVDYTAANAFLGTFAESRSARRPGQTVAIDWSAWQKVGMAARSIGASRQPRGGSPAKRPGHPWLEHRQEQDDEVVFTTDFSRSRQWVLGEHVLHGGDALIPGTGYLELVRAALEEIETAPAVEISRVFFQAPFMVRPDETKQLELVLRRADSRWEFRILSDAGALTHVTGYVRASAPPRAAPLDVSAIADRCRGSAEDIAAGFLKQSFMDFGPRWGNVRSIQYGDGEALLSLELPADLAPDLDLIKLHPALLDMATGGAQQLLGGRDSGRDFYVPFSYGRLHLRSAFPRRIFSHVKRQKSDVQSAVTFDVTIADEQGTVLAEIADFTMKKVDGRALTTPSPQSTPTAVPSALALAQEALREGILPDEGLAAFERILSCRVAPRVAVSSVDLDNWIRRIDADAAPTGANGTRGDAATSGSGAAWSGGTPVARRLAAMYSQILGVASVGPHDDFFALGGHSLLAVRLLARIEKELGKIIPLPTLFQTPTIEGLAAYLGDDRGPQETQSSVIVPFNEGEDGPAFFCVHSLGGEVMSFRHLARLLESSQRFYGIQAFPDTRNAESAASIEAMAQHYVEALIAFQPQGPYLLGGWSAGSVIALEMAQQLTARGHDVPLLVALDGAPFNTGTGTSPLNPLYYWKLLRNFPLWMTDDLMADFSTDEFVRRVRSKVSALGRKALSTLRREHDAHGHEVEGFMDTSYNTPEQVAFMKALFSALRRYVPRTYSGRVLLLAAKAQPLYHLLEVDRAWGAVSRHLDVLPVRGTHANIIREPYVHALADHLRTRLAELREAREQDHPAAGL